MLNSPAKQVCPLTFLGCLKWLDGNELLSVIEPYRQAILQEGLYSFEEDGRPRYKRVLAGRGKKNGKSLDLVLAAFYYFLAVKDPTNNDAFIVANDKGQAKDDLDLAKKLLEVNPILADEVNVYSEVIERKDGKGLLRIIPAQNVKGQHGKTCRFIGWDEIHAYRDFALFEALAPDPTRVGVMQWITSYSPLIARPGAPLTDLYKMCRDGKALNTLFSWYAADFGTDPNFNELETAEERANPSIASFQPGYLEDQRSLLPSRYYQRLHLNLSGSPEGAILDAGKLDACIIRERRSIAPDPHKKYTGFVDMSGGSGDDACLAVAHVEAKDLTQLDYLDKQVGDPPFNPRDAVRKFAAVLKDYGLATVYGDAYAGETFRRDFEAEGITYKKCKMPKTQIYEAFEPRVNAGSVELLDNPILEVQALSLQYRGSQVDHPPGDHDDFVNAAAGAIHFAARPPGTIRVIPWRM